MTLRKTALLLPLVAALFSATPAFADAPAAVTSVMTARSLQYPADIKWVTVDDVRKSLEGQGPINVSFDIDDTTLYSSGCFYAGQQKYSPGSDDYLGNQAFWDEVNAGCDQYSVPKDITRKIIKMHQDRNDQIFFITGRTAGKIDGVTPILMKLFGGKNIHPVAFMGNKPHPGVQDKTPGIIANKINLHYGDADSDIKAAREAGIRGIRVMRAPNSTYLPLPANGKLGEEVLKDSAW